MVWVVSKFRLREYTHVCLSLGCCFQGVCSKKSPRPILQERKHSFCTNTLSILNDWRGENIVSKTVIFHMTPSCCSYHPVWSILVPTGNPAGMLFWDPWEWGLSLTDKLSIWGKPLPQSAFMGLLREPGIGGQWMLRTNGGAWIPVQIKSHAVVWSDIQTSMRLVSWNDHFESPILFFWYTV